MLVPHGTPVRPWGSLWTLKKATSHLCSYQLKDLFVKVSRCPKLFFPLTTLQRVATEVLFKFKQQQTLLEDISFTFKVLFILSFFHKSSILIKAAPSSPPE